MPSFFSGIIFYENATGWFIPFYFFKKVEYPFVTKPKDFWDYVFFSERVKKKKKDFKVMSYIVQKKV